MMHNGIVSLLVAVMLLSIPVPSEASGKSSETELAAISARGSLLAGYDAAASHASDAVMASRPPESAVGRYIARKTATGWIVAFGRLNATNDRLLVTYEAVQAGDATRFEVRKYEPARQDTGFNLAAARGIETALTDFHGLSRPYNVAVLPAKPDGLFVYVYPAQVKAGVYPYGSDVRYRMSSDGATIIRKRQLHKSFLEFIPGDSPGKFAGGYHVHVLSDLPEDTDVLLVLTRTPRVPEMVAAGAYMFTIDVNGKITVADRPR